MRYALQVPQHWLVFILKPFAICAIPVYLGSIAFCCTMMMGIMLYCIELPPACYVADLPRSKKFATIFSWAHPRTQTQRSRTSTQAMHTTKLEIYIVQVRPKPGAMISALSAPGRLSVRHSRGRVCRGRATLQVCHYTLATALPPPTSL
jgi:hypothetical protein